MRRLIDEVVLDDDERALSSTLPPLSDPSSAARAVYDAVAGFGPLQRHLDDPSVEALWTNARLTQGVRPTAHTWAQCESGSGRCRGGRPVRCRA